MSIKSFAMRMAKAADKRFGLVAWVAGEPRPPRGGFDLYGEKLNDWGWVCVNLPPGAKRALEIGPGKSPIIPAMLALGYDVTAVDLSADISSLFAGIHFHYGDFQQMSFGHPFDVIVLCSVIEHFGLSGRYGSAEDPDGDLKAMRAVWNLLDPAGLVLLTTPVGKDAVHRPFHRVYGRERLKLLLDGFSVAKSRYVIKQPWGPWRETQEDEALSFGPDIQRYVLGQFVLQKRPVGR